MQSCSTPSQASQDQMSYSQSRHGPLMYCCWGSELYTPLPMAIPRASQPLLFAHRITSVTVACHGLLALRIIWSFQSSRTCLACPLLGSACRFSWSWPQRLQCDRWSCYPVAAGARNVLPRMSLPSWASHHNWQQDVSANPTRTRKQNWNNELVDTGATDHKDFLYPPLFSKTLPCKSLENLQMLAIFSRRMSWRPKVSQWNKQKLKWVQASCSWEASGYQVHTRHPSHKKDRATNLHNHICWDTPRQ